MSNTNPMRKKIQDIVSKRVLPLIEMDSGTVEIVRIYSTKGKVQVRLGGAYFGSPCRDVLVKYVIEPILKEEIDEINDVELVD